MFRQTSRPPAASPFAPCGWRHGERFGIKRFPVQSSRDTAFRSMGHNDFPHRTRRIRLEFRPRQLFGELCQELIEAVAGTRKFRGKSGKALDDLLCRQGYTNRVDCVMTMITTFLLICRTQNPIEPEPSPDQPRQPTGRCDNSLSSVSIIAPSVQGSKEL